MVADNSLARIPRLERSEAAKLLKARGITPTQQRVEIASILLARPQHLSADELLALVNGYARVSKATIYNTLGLFARKGLVREVIVDPSKVFYDSNTDPHHHFYNVSTGELTDICGVHVDVPEVPRLPDGTEVDGVDVIVRLRSK
ncbi:MAG: transcriptional repressor [Gammaproteobacteria bacterium]|nr:transcriptional repressor [Gammaproteobacteria bacterium]NIR28498.1 transcriptional repressor [Gammaproteobacteria bacterium]NIR97779.1 transcriptional repressor [Gammaproteobacteria bacterium]NIT62709.1 transcriptional repressor [Gammaproteobacteria bacterium]NIV20478.1 transcriptional repressor [Gammaproteobacteria bacterium]